LEDRGQNAEMLDRTERRKKEDRIARKKNRIDRKKKTGSTKISTGKNWKEKKIYRKQTGGFITEKNKKKKERYRHAPLLGI
jgi:hypothetical protein